MPIPTFDALMFPVLRDAAEKAWTGHDLVIRIADDLGLSRDEREQLNQGGQRTIANRVYWAIFHMKHAGLLEPKYGIVDITQRGRDLLRQKPSEINLQTLKQYEEYRAFRNKGKSSNSLPPDELKSTPEEQITAAAGALNEQLRDALLNQILTHQSVI